MKYYIVSDKELKELIESISIFKSWDAHGINLSVSNPKEEADKWVDKIKSKQPEL